MTSYWQAVSTALVLSLISAATSAVELRVGPTRTHKQLTAIVNLVNPGDVVLVDGSANPSTPNVYNAVQFTRKGTASAPITIRGEVPTGGRRPVISGGANTLRLELSDHIIVENFEVTGGTSRCVFSHAHNVTLRNLLVRDCPAHGILAADTESGDLLIESTEVTRIATQSTSDQLHAIYLSSDIDMYPNAVVTVRNSFVHDNTRGNGLKNRASRLNVYNNWLEAPDGFYPLQLNGSEEYDCILAGNRGCDADVVGNVILATGGNLLSFGDGTGIGSRGRIRMVNNTIVAGPAIARFDAILRIRGAIESIELHNNIFYFQNGYDSPIQFIRDLEADWVRGQRTIVGSRNVITLKPADYTGASFNWLARELTDTAYVAPTATLFSNASFANLSLLDLRIPAGSVARNVGSTQQTNLPGFEITNPLMLPAFQAILARPLPEALVPLQRPSATDVAGAPANGQISAGAFEFLNPNPLLTVTKSGGGSGTVTGDGIQCGSDCSQSYASGALVVLTAQSDAGSMFVQWTGCSNVAGNLCTVSVAGNTSVTATFAPEIAALIAPNDLNDDGRSDILWRTNPGGIGDTAAWLMNGTTVLAGAGLTAGSPYQVTHAGDFDGDGKADLAFRHLTTGEVTLFRMDGTNVIGGASILSADTGYTIQHLADFNGDGKADILWQRPDGAMAIWIMNGLTVQGGAGLLPAGTGWVPKHTGDFNGDGKADILWQNADGSVAIWLMDGLTVTTGGAILAAGSGYIPEHVGDFNGDGKTDILWKAADGAYFAWLMNGLSVTQGGALLGGGSGYTVTHVADLGGDQKSDLLFRNTADGSVILWEMNGLTVTLSTQIEGPATGWTIKRARDYSGDGKADLLWEHTDGSYRLMVMNGGAITANAVLIGPGTGYQAVP